MEHHEMSLLVIGLGFRDEATAQSIGEALSTVVARAAWPEAETVIAVPEDKAAHPALRAAATASCLSIQTASADAMHEADARVITRSEQAKTHRGVGSVCEAAALAVAGADGRLIVTRIISADRRATAAAAIKDMGS
jgi:cobalt-precorrin 5A hydrolase